MVEQVTQKTDSNGDDIIKKLALNYNDIKIIRQNVLDLRLKIDIYDRLTNEYLDTMECGLINGAISIDTASDIRTTASIIAVPVKNKRLNLDKDSIIWLNRIAKIYIGIYDIPAQQWHWYKQGDFVFTNYDINYDATTNEISLSCADKMTLLDGTKNGQLGALNISYPAYEEDINTGEVIKYNYIRDAVITTLSQLGEITDYEIDDIGEFKGMPDCNPEYIEYREQSKVQVKDGSYQPTWNAIPYDQIFSAGCNILSILTTFRDLYPNYEMYFNKNGTFCCNMIPSCYSDDIIFDSDFFDKIYISENTTVDLNTVRNVCEVWGQTIETDFYTEDCSYSNNTYSCNISNYTEYCNGDIVAILIPSQNNQHGSSVDINGLGTIPIIDENTEEYILENSMESGQIYAFKIKKKRIEKKDIFRIYLLGQWQPHGLNVLTNGTISNIDYKIPGSNKIVKKYSLEYFQEVYNCTTISFTRALDSPFCVQELGEILDVKTGGEFDNITSDSLALARAEYENWKNCRLTDSITAVTKICPFADVNIKVSYRRKDNNDINQYIVKSLSHDLSKGTTTWQLMRFYPLYSDEELKDIHTWGWAQKYSWQAVNRYKWEDFK